MESFFNIFFLGTIVCFFTSRLFYGLFHAKNILLNPFVLLLFPYSPGLSLIGGVIGGGIFALYLHFTNKKQLPLGRMFDFCSVGFLVTMPVGILGYFMFAEEKFSLVRTISLMAVYVVLFSIFWKIFLPWMLNGKFKDGTISFLFLMCFSVISLTLSIAENFKHMLTLENAILLIMFIAAVAGLIRQELLVKSMKR